MNLLQVEPDSSIVLQDKRIALCIGHHGLKADALFEAYRTSPDKDAFVAALIGRLLVGMARSVR
jgi:hypothetical protein